MSQLSTTVLLIRDALRVCPACSLVYQININLHIVIFQTGGVFAFVILNGSFSKETFIAIAALYFG